MTNLQLLLTIALPTLIPTLAILLSMAQNHARFNVIESRLVAIEGDLRRFYQELGRVQGQVTGLEARGR